MRKAWLGLFLTAVAACGPFHEDYSVLVVTEPPAAEVWKGNFYLGRTPYALTATATEEEDEAGQLHFPALILRREGYRDRALELELPTGEGHQWECLVELEPGEGEEND